MCSPTPHQGPRCALCSPTARSLTTEDDDDDDLVPRAPASINELRLMPRSSRYRRSVGDAMQRAALVSHSCVVGLRAPLKPERFWFDSRGWDETQRTARCLGSVAKLGLQLVLTQSKRRFESDRAHEESRTQIAADADSHKPVPTGTTKQVRHGDKSVRHTGCRRFDPGRLLRSRGIASRRQPTSWAPGSRSSLGELIARSRGSDPGRLLDALTSATLPP